MIDKRKWIKIHIDDLKMLARALDVCYEMYELEVGVIVDLETVKAREYAKNILREKEEARQK